MSIYLDASALIKRYLDEPGSDEVESAMRGARWIASQIAFVETLRAVSSEPSDLVRRAQKEWESFYVVEVAQPLCERAVAIAVKHGLRSLDAIHLASALAVATDDLIFATWDRQLHAAASAEGLRTLPASLP